jgi:AraC-like DNA-binding protein
MVVRQQLEAQNFQVTEIDLGTANVNSDPSEQQLDALEKSLENLGFELIDKDKNKIVERIKNIIIDLIHYRTSSEPHANYSEILSGQLHKEYNYLSRLFSEHENTTIEKFIILQKVERAKALLQEGEWNLNEIAFHMGYSSSSHLSSQFKAVTGISPREFKALEINNRKALDKI